MYLQNTVKDLKKEYGCSSLRRCVGCKKKYECEIEDAVKYGIYIDRQKKWIKTKFFCNRIKEKCKLKECSFYDKCYKKEKTNYEIWKRAFYNNKKEDLEKLMRGGM